MLGSPTLPAAAPAARMRHNKRGVASVALVVVTLLLATTLLFTQPVNAAVNSVTVTGGAGTVEVEGTLYAKSGQSVTITVVTADTACKVEFSGAHSGTVSSATSSTKTTKTWTSTFAVSSGDGTKSVTATATDKVRSECNGSGGSASVSYVADNTKPSVTSSYSTGAPNAAGWSRQDVSITWAGDDAGSGFVRACTGATSDNPAPCTSAVSTETSGTTINVTGVDRVGNSQSASAVVKLDKTKPNLTVPDSFTREATSSSGATVTYGVSAGDVLSGPTTITPSCSRPSGAMFALGDTVVSCTATDVAGNTQTKTFTVTVSDTVGPVFGNVPVITAAEGDELGGKRVSWVNPTATDAVSGERVVTCDPQAGALFPVGSTRVTCSAADAAGNPNTAQFDVIVTDTTRPVLVLPADFNVEARTAAGAAVDYVVRADDVVDGPITPLCSPSSGTELALGPHSVACSAVDASANMVEGSFTVTVVDTTKPVFRTAPTVNPFEATGPGGALVSFDVPVAEDAVSGNLDGTCTTSGITVTPGVTILAVGHHQVTCTATDGAGNQAEALRFGVTVQDTTQPEILNAPADRTVEAVGPDGATSTWDLPTATDLVDVAVAVTCSPASGSTFRIGETTVTCSAQDRAGNRREVTFDVKVEDTTPPAMTQPVDVTQEATGSSGAIVIFDDPSATDAVDPAPVVSCTPGSGHTFPIATTRVTCSSVDAARNPAVPVTFTVTVQDTTAPVVSVPANITVDATSASGAVVNFTAAATDHVDGSVTPTCSAASGATFPVGQTTVRCNARDTANNDAVEQSFTVTVGPWLSYSFGGFQRPVDGSGVLNRAKAGSAIPVKFSLGGDKTLDIWAAGSTGPGSGTKACSSTTLVDIVEETVTAGGSSLKYDATSDTYTYVWKSDAKWSGTCRQLVLPFKDGTTQRAEFHFTK